MKKFNVYLMAISALFTFSVASADHFEDAIKYRKSAFLLMRANLAPIKSMVKGKFAFNREQMVTHARNIEVLSRMPWEYFVAGTEKGDTDAKPEVWKEPEEYQSAITNFQRESAKLARVAQKGDESAVEEQVKKLSKGCKSCHDDFKYK